MKVTKTNYLFLISLLTFCAGCPMDRDPVIESIELVNNSDTSIVFTYIFKMKEDTLLGSLPSPITVENSDHCECK